MAFSNYDINICIISGFLGNWIGWYSTISEGLLKLTRLLRVLRLSN